MVEKVVTRVETVKIVLDIPKPIIDFFENQIQLYGSEKDTVEKFILSALVEAVDAALNDLECSCRRNVVTNFGLDKILNQ